MKDRILQILQAKELSSARFAEIMGVQPSSISHLLSGRNNPNYDFISRLLERFPDIDPDWFIAGKGVMFRKENALYHPEEKCLSLPLFEQPLAEKTKKIAAESVPSSSSPEKTIEKVIIFYDDRSFEVYFHKKN